MLEPVNQVLNESSEVNLPQITTEDIIKDATVLCPTCHKAITDAEQVEFLNDQGECPQCDHVRGEVQEMLQGEEVMEDEA